MPLIISAFIVIVNAHIVMQMVAYNALLNTIKVLDLLSALKHTINAMILVPHHYLLLSIKRVRSVIKTVKFVILKPAYSVYQDYMVINLIV